MKPTQTCILVADEHVAKFFVNCGPGKGITPLPEFGLTREVYSSTSTITDQQGRVFDITGEGRHALEPRSDPKNKQAKAFLKMTVQTLEEAVRRKAFDRFILVAPPKAMSEIRRILPPQMRHNIRGELVKDLTHASTDELGRHLDKIFPVTP